MGCNLLLPGAADENRMLLLWPREGVLCRLHLMPLVLEWIQLSVVLLLLLLPWYVLGRAWNLDLALDLSLSIPLAMHLDLALALILTLALLLQVMKMMLTVLLHMLLPGRRPALLP